MLLVIIIVISFHLTLMSGGNNMAFEFCLMLVASPWASHITSLFLSFLVFKTGIILVPTEKAILSSILAWRIPWTEKPSGPQSTGSQRVRHD